jgi:hypothetical protein
MYWDGDDMSLRILAKWSPEVKRRWLKIAGIAVLQLLLMGASFVGGRMLAQQGARGRGQFAIQLPSELPKDPVAGTGSVQKIQGDTITIAAGRGFGGFGGQGGQGGQTANSQIDVATTAETKYYINTTASVAAGAGGQRGTQTQVQVAAAALNDVKVGGTILVWGPKSGQRITADVIYIQSAGR